MKKNSDKRKWVLVITTVFLAILFISFKINHNFSIVKEKEFTQDTNDTTAVHNLAIQFSTLWFKELKYKSCFQFFPKEYIIKNDILPVLVSQEDFVNQNPILKKLAAYSTIESKQIYHNKDCIVVVLKVSELNIPYLAENINSLPSNNYDSIVKEIDFLLNNKSVNIPRTVNIESYIVRKNINSLFLEPIPNTNEN